MTLHKYLNQQYSSRSVRAYEERISYYLSTFRNPETAGYNELMDYLYEQRKGLKPSRVQSLLQGIKKYYNYLQAAGLREDNPSVSIQLKGIKSLPIVANRILTKEEIEKIWQYFLTKDYRYRIRKNRDISLVGLLLKQGIRRKEIEVLTIQNIDLEKGTIFIPETIKTNARTLALETSQILPFYRYLNEERPKLLTGKLSTNSLFFTKKEHTEKAITLGYLIQTAKPIIKDKTINLRAIRMSVIANQFMAGHSLQQVQYFAGHLYPSSTERYEISDLQALQEGIMKHHPLQVNWESETL